MILENSLVPTTVTLSLLLQTDNECDLLTRVCNYLRFKHLLFIILLYQHGLILSCVAFMADVNAVVSVCRKVFQNDPPRLKQLLVSL